MRVCGCVLRWVRRTNVGRLQTRCNAVPWLRGEAWESAKWKKEHDGRVSDWVMDEPRTPGGLLW